MNSTFARSCRALLAPALLVACVLLFAAARAEAALPSGFNNELLVGGLVEPIDIAFLPDGRALVLQKGGEIAIVDPSAAPATSASYMTITDITSDGEKGLLAIALDPDFAINDYFYLYYLKASVGKLRISRFTHMGNVGNLGSEFLVWENPQETAACCHYGGGLSVGPDGALYLTTGENFDANQSQDLTRAGGKVMRVNRDGTIPNDNPFVDGPLGNLDEIWAFGLRNPFRASWDLVDGRFYIGEVGGNNQNTATEDIHLGVAGANYGWPFCEGDCGTPGYDDPLFHYHHSGSGASVTGGFVYRGSSFPAAYQGAYFYGDYVRQFIRYLSFEPDGSVAGDFAFEDAASSVVGMKEGPDGSLYYVDIWLGEFRRIVFQQGNQWPIVDQATASVTDGLATLSVTFTGAATDPEGQPLDYHWIFGDGSEADGAVLVHDYTSNGVYKARLRVSDGVHTVFSEEIEIRVGSPPQVTITEPADGDFFRAGEVIDLAGTATDDGPLVPGDYSWTVLFNHNAHDHPGMGPTSGTTATFAVEESGHDFSDSTSFDIILTVTDVDGLTGSDTVTIEPEKVYVGFYSNLPGTTLQLDGISRTLPFAHDTLIDFHHEVATPLRQCVGGVSFVLSGWSDGGAPTHQIQVPAYDSSLSTTYFAEGPCSPRVTDGLQVLYDFSAGSGSTVSDRSGLQPALDLTISNPAATQWLPNGGLSVESPTSLETAGPATRLGAALKASETLTVEAWVEPVAELAQFGPARIVAYSENGFPAGGNFVLGQTYDSESETGGYAARLRTTATNQYGVPNLETPTGLATSELTHLVFTRDALHLTRIFVDGVQVAQSSRVGDFTPWDDLELVLANEPSEDRAWLGKLFLVAIYDRALAPAEVTTNFQAGPGTIDPPSAVPALPPVGLGLVALLLIAIAARQFVSPTRARGLGR